MNITDETKNDIIHILEELMDPACSPGILDYDSEAEQILCVICFGRSEDLLSQKRDNPEAAKVQHKDNCPVVLASKLIKIFK